METLQLREEFYWTGIVDDQLRVFDIIMYTEFGTSCSNNLKSRVQFQKSLYTSCMIRFSVVDYQIIDLSDIRNLT